MARHSVGTWPNVDRQIMQRVVRSIMSKEYSYEVSNNLEKVQWV